MLKPGISLAVPFGASAAFCEDADPADRELDGIANEFCNACSCETFFGKWSVARGETTAGGVAAARGEVWIALDPGTATRRLEVVSLDCCDTRASSEDGARLVVAGTESEDFIEVAERRARFATRIAGIEPRADRCAWNRQPSCIGIPVRHARKKRKSICAFRLADPIGQSEPRLAKVGTALAFPHRRSRQEVGFAPLGVNFRQGVPYVAAIHQRSAPCASRDSRDFPVF
jgi:hypothetical protein